MPFNRLEKIEKEDRRVNWPISEGIVPVRQLAPSSRAMSADKPLTEGEIVPVKDKLFNVKPWIAPVPSHVTRLQVHFDVTSPHVHPVNPFVPIFVEEIKSHSAVSSVD